MLRNLTPNLMVENVRETVNFYNENLGFKLVSSVPEEGEQLGWAMVQRDDVAVMFQSRESMAEDFAFFGEMPVGGSLGLFVSVADVEALHAALDGKVEVIKGLHDTFYGAKEFYIKDNNGYVMGFSEMNEIET